MTFRFAHLAVITPALFLAACGDSSSSTGTTSGGATCAPGDGCPTVQTDCIGLVDNSMASTYSLRISHLTIEKPAVLTDVVVKGLLDGGVSLNLPSCKAETGDPLFPMGSSLGAFSWLLQFDKSTNKLTTGGAYPEADPTAGYCFVKETIQGFPIQPLVVDAPVGSDGKFSIATPEDVVVPVYSDVMKSSVILLPLRQVTIHDATISSDHNCIGKQNPDLDPNNLCLPDSTTPPFVDDASLDGFAVLEDADKVAVDQLGGKSLCVILSGDNACNQFCDAAKKKCARDAMGQIVFAGDYCSTANGGKGGPATATCHDAVQLSGKFAASSVAMKASCP
jgi:hypothetical protein